jgi:protein TIF31
VVFTQADIDSGAIAKDEVLVKDLAQFLKDQAIQKLVRDLQAVEGVPTDSESLEQAFHAHGVNMRYLGTVASVVAGQELHHIKTLLEREVVVRSVKHLVNHELRESSDTHLSATLAHLFNLLLAPFPLLEKLETGSIGYPITPIESLK